MLLILLILPPTLAFLTSAPYRSKRQAALAIPGGYTIPFTLRSAITCLIPGIKENICLGPRVQVLKKERIGLTDRYGAAYGYHNGVDLRGLEKYNLPLVRDETEIGRSIGAVVDVNENDGALEVGTRSKVLNVFQVNQGVVSEWDRTGAGADIGTRIAAADDTVKFKHTLFGINVGPTHSRNIIGPYKVGSTRGSKLKGPTLAEHYHGYYHGRGDWYANQFKRPGDEYRTKEQRACPWCVAVDPTYPTQNIFNGLGPYG